LYFDFILGVDQTGAKASKGKFKKLPVCFLSKSQGEFQLKGPLYLESFDWSSIEQLFLKNNLSVVKEKTLVVADCVLGLPKKVIETQNPLDVLLLAMRQAAAHEGVGLKAGEDFFFKHFPEIETFSPSDLLRAAEAELGCLSVFKNKPFQKNIQTGTYRIWSDLGQDCNYNDFNIWPYQNEKGRAYLCEGYPSYAFQNLNDNLKIDIQNFSKDHQDAAALAYLGAHAFDKNKKNESLKEGCILVHKKGKLV